MFIYVSSAFSVVMLLLIYYFQIKQTNKKKSVKGVSVSMNYMKNAVTILTLISLVLSGSALISYISQLLSLVLGTVTIFQYYHFKGKESD